MTLCKAGPSNNGPSLPETAIDADDPNQDIEQRRKLIDIVWRMKRPSRVTGGSCLVTGLKLSPSSLAVIDLKFSRRMGSLLKPCRFC